MVRRGPLVGPHEIGRVSRIVSGSIIGLTRGTSKLRPVHVLVVAKAPEPGRSKTRLCPPCSPQEAAAIAEAALADTLEAVAACGVDRRVLALDGPPGPWLPPGFEVIPQVSGSLDVRLCEAWMTAGGPG